MQYVQDYDETFPGRYANWGYPDAQAGAEWYNVMMPYLKNRQILQCPSDKATLAYGYNTENVDGYPLGTGGTLAQIQNPSLIMAIGDTVANQLTAYRPANYPNNFAGWCGVYGIRHNDGLNLVFVDGHVKWFKPAVVYNGGSDRPFYTD